LPQTDDRYDHQILQAIAAGGHVTQRSLSGELGVALGLTNLLIRRLVGKGYVRMSRLGTRHVRYLMTPAGWDALARATRLSLENTIHLYTQTREQIRASLREVSARCPIDASGHKCVVFYGAGDVAEIAYVGLQGTDLTLVGIVDDKRRGKFFGLTISSPEELSAEQLAGISYARIIVASIRHADAIRERVVAAGVPGDRIVTL
jgi:DNA-binding MarR family transcriptional regulator